jgi:6-phosphogluconolactonase
LAEFSPEEAAQQYAQSLKTFFGLHGRFDLVLLGMGDDGHTASLFPETAALDMNDRLVVENYVPQLDTWRITLTAPLINQAARVAFLVAGASKSEPLREVLYGRRQPHTFPSQMIAPDDGELVWFVDQAAAAKLER